LVLIGNHLHDLKELALYGAPPITDSAIDALFERIPCLSGVQRDVAINVKVVNQRGKEIYFKLQMSTKLNKLFSAYAQKERVKLQGVRFLFDGQRVSPNQTPFELAMENGDVIDVMVEQQGGRDWMPAPAGHAYASRPAIEQVLAGSLAPQALSSADVAHICQHAVGPHFRSPQKPLVWERQLVPAVACSLLIHHADGEHAARLLTGCLPATLSDLQLPLSHTELFNLIGAAANALLALGAEAFRASLRQSGQSCSEYGGMGEADSTVIPPPRIVLRRKSTSLKAMASERIVFHRDYAQVVANVALNADYVGGQLLVASGHRIACPDRPGVCTVLNHAAVHGVSSLQAGTRYTLLASFGM